MLILGLFAIRYAHKARSIKEPGSSILGIAIIALSVYGIAIVLFGFLMVGTAGPF